MLRKIKKLKDRIRAKLSRKKATQPVGPWLMADNSIDHEMQGAANATLTLPSGDTYSGLVATHRRMSIVGRSVDGGRFIKIGVASQASRRLTTQGEIDVIRHLNARNCVSCPTLHDSGRIDREILLASLTGEARALVAAQTDSSFIYLVIDFVKSASRIPFPDAVLSLMEQKRLGVYCGDFKPRNLRYDSERGICFIVDYDQAVMLDPGVSEAGGEAFAAWANEEEKRHFGQTSFLRQFSGIKAEAAYAGLFRNGAFNLASTELLHRQKTTRAEGGIYHSLATPLLFADGVRSLDDRGRLLKHVAWQKSEAVLDVGCNNGLLSFYLHDQGCRVTGVDMDPDIITSARFTANIIGKQVRFAALDLDRDPIPDGIDTVMLFSVLHHTQNIEANAAKIAMASRRVIIECRLNERGAKPVDGVWVSTSKWSFETMEALQEYLVRIFPGFSVHGVVGGGDKHRYIIELTKAA